MAINIFTPIICIHLVRKTSCSILVGYEQSILNVKMQEQSGRLFGGFIFQKREWAIISTSVQNMLGIAYVWYSCERNTHGIA